MCDDTRFDHIFAYHGELVKRICHGVRVCDPWAVLEAARAFSIELPPDATIIPMPGHNGRAVSMLMVANAISRMRPDIRVMDVLLCIPHESVYLQKKQGWKPAPVSMFTEDGEQHEGAIIIDSVIDTGNTAMAAINCLRTARVMAFAMVVDQT